ncbi:MAG: hypothetical protein ACYDBV_01625 [Nitrospiria bacterium]
MNLKRLKVVKVFLILLTGSGCGLGSPSGGHDPSLPLPVIISDNAAVLVDHTKGAIVITPDGKAMLSIPQTALNKDTEFTILSYDLGASDGPIFRVGQLYSFKPVNVPELIQGQVLTVTLFYDSSLFPVNDPRVISPATPFVPESDVRLAVFQENADLTLRCWQTVFLDAPSVIPGKILHQVTTRATTQLGIFGITSIYSYVCPFNFLNPPH